MDLEEKSAEVGLRRGVGGNADGPANEAAKSAIGHFPIGCGKACSSARLSRRFQELRYQILIAGGMLILFNNTPS